MCSPLIWLFESQIKRSSTISSKNHITFFICGALRDIVSFVQFKKRKKHPWRSATFNILKETLLHRCFSRFLNYKNGTKCRKAHHILPLFAIVSKVDCEKRMFHIKILNKNASSVESYGTPYKMFSQELKKGDHFISLFTVW